MKKTYVLIEMSESGKVEIPIQNKALINLQFPCEIIVGTSDDFDCSEDNPNRKTFDLSWFVHKEIETT